MIDEKWLKELRLDLGEGYRLDGVHVGGTNAALKVIHPDGRVQGYRMTRDLFLFPSYIHEVPNWLVPSPQYDVDRLNRKLSNLLGDPHLHILIRTYDLLFNSILETFFQGGESDLGSIVAETDEAKAIWGFIIQTPGIAYRLEDYATRSTDRKRRTWAEQALGELRRLGPGDADLPPEALFDNPLVVWGGAVSEAFFTKAELPQAVAAVEGHLRALPDEQMQIYLEQMYALLFALHSIEDMPPPTSISVFCDATGFYPEQFATEEDRAAPDGLGALLEFIKSSDRGEDW